MQRGAGFIRILRTLGWIATAPAVGCASADPTLGTTESAIYSGTKDDSSDDAVVALRIGSDTQSYRLCTGALIAPNVILTARHCTSIAATDTIGCNAAGQSTNGNQFLGDVTPSDIHVYTGVTPIMSATPRASGKQVFRLDTNCLCNSDVALVVLDKNVDGISPLRVRLSGDVAIGETIRSVGYGENDTSYTSGVRYRKDGVSVLALGAGVMKDGTVLGSGELEIGRATCQGDSGGPGISEQTGAIIGVASRGVSCTQDYGHVYMRLTGVRSLFDEAFAVAGGAPLEEPPMPSGNTSTPTSGDVPLHHGGCRMASDSPSDEAVVALGAILLGLGVRLRRRKSNEREQSDV